MLDRKANRFEPDADAAAVISELTSPARLGSNSSEIILNRGFRIASVETEIPLRSRLAHQANRSQFVTSPLNTEAPDNTAAATEAPDALSSPAHSDPTLPATPLG